LCAGGEVLQMNQYPWNAVLRCLGLTRVMFGDPFLDIFASADITMAGFATA
jgi:hypothetical protein